MTDTEQLRAALQRYLRGGVDGFEACNVLGLAPFGDGHSGATYKVDIEFSRGNNAFVLRTSPSGAPLKGPGDIGRQARIMKALETRGLSVPHVLASSSEGVLLHRSFALMEMVAGEPWTMAVETWSHGSVASQAVKVLAELREVPVEETGIASDRTRTPPDEVTRWERLAESLPEARRRRYTEVAGRLVSTAPRLSTVGLVHGDYHYGNLLFHEGKVAAVLDWEIASLGDPLFDLASLVVASLRRRFQDEPNTAGDVDISQDELCGLYGIEPEVIDWYVAATCFKYAIILEYNLYLHRSGKKRDPIYESLHWTRRGLLQEAAKRSES